MRKVSILKFGLFAFLAVALLLPSTGRADTFTSLLSTGNTAISGFTGPYGTVTVDLTSSTMASITFTANSTATNNFYFIDTSAAAVEVNATSWTLSGLTGTAASFGAGVDLSDSGAGTADGFGSFNQTFKEFDGYNWALTSITFDLTNTSGTWLDAASVLAFNSLGFDAAAHIAVCDLATNPDCSTAIGAIATGFAGEGPGTIHKNPEPASLGLFGSGLVSLAYLIRRRRKK
jgi:hypothetical protein